MSFDKVLTVPFRGNGAVVFSFALPMALAHYSASKEFIAAFLFGSVYKKATVAKGSYTPAYSSSPPGSPVRATFSPANEPAAIADDKYCSNCGVALLGDDSFCSNCGSKVDNL